MSERKKPLHDFVNLHCHTGLGSIWDAIDLCDKHMNAVWDNGMDAMAITEHGNCNSVAYSLFHKEKMVREGKSFKYIIGCEAYFVPDLRKWRKEYGTYREEKEKSKKKNEDLKGISSDFLKGRSHLVLLAQNQEGLYNLYKMISLSYKRENFYRYPRIDFDILRKYNKGIIASSACLSGYLSIEYLKNKQEMLSGGELYDHMCGIIEKFLDIFGDRFYGELQWNSVKEQHEINKMVISMSQKYGFDLISTCDSHYPTRSAWKDRELYKRLGWMGKIVNKPDFNNNELPKTIDDLQFELYPKNWDQMWESYEKYSKICGVQYDDEVIRKSLENTCKIAYERVEEYEPDKTIRLPQFIKEKGETPEYTLSRLAIQGLKDLGLRGKKEYVDRLKREIKVIQKKKFSEYFLTMKQVVDFARETQGIVGCARGSAGGCLLSYCLGITQIDPIRWELQFERFLSEESSGYPDIDFDVMEPMELKENLAKKWGEYSVIPVSNFTTLQLKSLVKDISKFYDVPFQEVNEVTNKMMFEATPQAKKDHDIVAGVYNPNFEEVKKYSKTFYNFITKFPKVADHIEALSGQIRQISRHASGTIIGEKLNEYMPLISSKGVLQTPWPEGQTIRLLEPMGFIKFDILGLASLRMMRQAIYLILKNHKGVEDPSLEDIKRFYNENVHPDVVDFSDQKVYETVFHKFNFHNVFQFQEKGAQTFCVNAKPKSLDDISVITSIYRPGPLSSGYDKQFIENKNDPGEIEYLHPLLKGILEKSYGLCVYQEQIAQIVHELGKNVSLEEGNQLRKLLIKRGSAKDEKKKEKIYNKYMEGCSEKDIPKEKAQDLWESLQKFSAYGFNKSHSCAYSIISFQTAWFLTYYPAEWACAFLEKDTEFEDKKEKAISGAKHMGFTIEEANINTSGDMWEVSKEKESTLIQPLTSIKGIGAVAIQKIIENRRYNTIEDLILNPEIPISKVNKRCLEILIKSQTLNHLMDSRFNHLKHFYLSICDKRPSNSKQLEENIIIYSNEPDFTEEEKIEFYIEYTGIFPIDKVMPQKILRKLDEKSIPPISEFNEELGLCWAIVRGIEKKSTAKGKEYYNLVLVDKNFVMSKIRCWGINPIKDKLFVNRPYLISPKWDPVWGMSTNGPLFKSWKLLG
ncbi:MAG: DNA polymerase III subunit alpha [Nanoarchaeota archaeon]|nr:DNA polymerase III subunit alpha [Nanoarchaeota archaeon]